ncbi:MAG: hypothetical protein ACJ8EN_14175 [Xanthobacteraceae bacterium]
MRLALRFCDVNEIGQGKPPRASQDRSRHGDLVVVGKIPHHSGRRVSDRSEALADLRKNCRLDLLDQAFQDALENGEMLFAEGFSPGDEQIRDTPQVIDALFTRGAGDRCLQLDH